MIEKLVVRIPLDNAHRGVDAVTIEAKVLEQQSKFWPLFERSIDVDDGRYTLVENSVEVQQVEFDDAGTSGNVEVDFMSSFYAGCKDINSDDWHSESLPFEISNDALVFESIFRFAGV